MTPSELEQAAKECFERTSKGFANAPAWNELHDDTRRVYYDWVLRCRYGEANSAPGANNE